MAANDINLAALAEHRHGAGRDARYLLVVATGHRGVGGALVLDGALYSGSSGLGMEAGHVSVDPQGRPIDRTVSDFHARVVQHEVDHLDGILYPRRIRDLTQFGFTDTLFPCQNLADD